MDCAEHSYVCVCVRINLFFSYQEEIRKLKNELDHFDPAFFEEIEDLKYNYNEEVKKNIVLEEKLKTLSEKFGVQVDIPGRISID